ncbi:MAG: RagB/SusD family nutrient uptake outer membrane protein [Prevotellaceae bacterium]|jgi:hypothetical protein|nr:RagB/SusD family nutrient uptake outer membrane protein [Prevotellaceae bacterium]
MKHLYSKLQSAVIILFASFFITLTSCSDFLDVTPSDGINGGDAFANIANANASLHGIYDGLQSVNMYNANYIFWGDLRGEDMKNTDLAGGRGNAFYRFSHISPETAQPNFWTYPYSRLGRINNLIQAFENNAVAIGPNEENIAKNIFAQGYALRALMHFELVRKYGEPYLKNKSAHGVIIVTEPVPTFAKLQRSTVEQAYIQIVDDLTKAISLYPPLASRSKDNYGDGYLNVWAAKALLARVYLTMGEWDKAFTTADDVIRNASLFSLTPNAEYVNSWGLEFQKESLFALVNSSQDVGDADRETVGYVFDPNGYGDLVITDGFRALLKSDPDDVRLKLLGTDRLGTAESYLMKYPGRDGSVMTNNINVIRLSEVYLIAAEAALKKPAKDQAAANKYLNAIRQRANPAATDVVATEILILDERRKELVGEGNRFNDIIRLGLTVTRPEILSDQEVKVVSWNEHRIILPIGRSEIDINPDIYQNEGYRK